jgi:putative redox protein
MAAQITVQYQGKLRCQAVRNENGQIVTTDVGADHGGQGEYYSPVELAAAALGTCVTSMVAFVGERSNVDLSSMQTAVSFDMATSPARRIGSIKVTVKLPNSVPEAVRPKLEIAAKSCPVKNSLHPDIQITVELVYG